jgi:arylsulfatase A-like enzyme
LWRNEDKVPLLGNLEGRREQYSHDLLTLEALAFVERHRDKSFFLYLPYTIPHAKLEVPSDAPYSHEDWPQPQKNHAAMITRMDRDIGRLVELLDRLGILDRTLIFFTSDNGPHAEGGGKSDFFDSNGPLQGIKRDMYEGGVRVPLVVRWPKYVEAGRVSDQVWAMWDFLPTVAELVGVEPPEGLDGISMVNALRGQKQRDHDYLYWEFYHRGRWAQALRAGDYKIVRNEPGKSLELYDLSRDLGEKHDLANEKPDVLNRLERMMAGVRTESPHWPTR